jgi:hypothetical protein
VEVGSYVPGKCIRNTAKDRRYLLESDRVAIDALSEHTKVTKLESTVCI